MMTKSEIRDAITFLLQSARDRKTDQGMLVYTTILEMIDGAQDERTVREILGRLNNSLASIESHGDFTDREFEKVLLLRNGED